MEALFDNYGIQMCQYDSGVSLLRTGAPFTNMV